MLKTGIHPTDVTAAHRAYCKPCKKYMIVYETCNAIVCGCCNCVISAYLGSSTTNPARPALYLTDNGITAWVHPAEEGGYWAEVTLLPGCITEADTLDALAVTIKEAVAGWLSAQAIEEGLPR